MTKPPPISRRKSDHIEVVLNGQAEVDAHTTLLEEVLLLHQALPEASTGEIDLSTRIAGRELAAPLIISGMTGGTDVARAINRDLARLAEKFAIGFGVGSQRAMAEYSELEASFQVRDVAPDVFLLGNLGAIQAHAYGRARVAELAERIGADAMAIHLNPAMELIQDHGDRDFRGALATIADLVAELPIPIIVKETGCGLSPSTCQKLRDVGVSTVDVSGSGGTSFVAIEKRRAAAGSPGEALAADLSGWGIPTAVSVAAAVAAGLEVIASGGLRTGLDMANSLALGASCTGLAGPILRAHHDGGFDGAVTLVETLLRSLRSITLLAGATSCRDLATAPRHLGRELRHWFDELGLR